MKTIRYLLVLVGIVFGVNAATFDAARQNESDPDCKVTDEIGENVKSLSKLIKASDTLFKIQGKYDLKGATLTIPSGCRLIGLNANLTNGKLILKSGCQIDNCSFDNIQILISDAEHVRIHDCFFTGSFNPKKIKPQNYKEAAIYCSNIKDCEFKSISISKVQWGLAVFDSYRVLVDNIIFTGILNAPIDYSKHIENANYHDAVHLSNTHFSRVCNVAAYNCGACVLLGRTSKSNVIEGCKGDLLWDNGVYISSGNNNIVQSCCFNNVRGTGVKARGSCNVLSNNTVTNVSVGYVLTGNGLAIGKDEYGNDYNGYGSIINGNVVMNAYNYGILIGEQDGLPPYRFSVVNNSIVNGPRERASISVNCDGASIVSNSIYCPNSFGIVIPKLPDRSSGGYMISDNNVFSKSRGIVTQKCKDVMVTNNVINSEAQGVEVFATESSFYIMNKFSGKGKYSVGGHIKGTSNHYKTIGVDNALTPSQYIIIDK